MPFTLKIYFTGKGLLLSVYRACSYTSTPQNTALSAKQFWPVCYPVWDGSREMETQKDRDHDQGQSVLKPTGLLSSGQTALKS